MNDYDYMPIFPNLFADEHCVPYGVCEANVCLVGLLKASNAGLTSKKKFPE
jgi:hypothetical protein